MKIHVEIRSGAYYDSIVLMQLQSFLEKEEGVARVAVMMGTSANKQILEQSNLWTEKVKGAESHDLMIIVEGEPSKSEEALAKIDTFLQRKTISGDDDYKPKSIETALTMLPDANIVSISVASNFAVDVAQKALDKDLHVFLYTDNISQEDERTLKENACAKGLLVMGPDCGTAIINGIGLGFANKARKGNIGIIAASGTGLQTIASRIHQMGGGVSHAIGTGGRDLSNKIDGITTKQSLLLLNKDKETEIIVMVSKPPAKEVARKLLSFAATMNKPVIVAFLGYKDTEINDENIYFVSSLEEAAKYAVQLGSSIEIMETTSPHDFSLYKEEQKYLRGLFSGGTLAYDALLCLKQNFDNFHANISLEHVKKLENISLSNEHTIIDLGADEFTAGRLHPMMDQKMRLARFEQEAKDPQTAIILFDIVLGYGSHQNPCEEWVEAIGKIRDMYTKDKRYLDIICVIIGTDDDPQNLTEQKKLLEDVGVKVFVDCDDAWNYCFYLLKVLEYRSCPQVKEQFLKSPSIINIGLVNFYESLQNQEVPSIQLDWSPPANGDEKLMAILKRLSS